MPESPEERELRLVDAVDFKILFAANDEKKLQDVLHKYLAPLLLKAASPHNSVREKIQEVFARIYRFVKPPGVVLPVEALIDQYKSTPAPIVQHMDALFIRHSIPRLEPADRVRLLPGLIRFLGTDVHPTASQLLNCVLFILLDFNVPPRGSQQDEGLRDSLGLSDPKDAAFVAKWLGNVLRLKVAAGAQASIDDFGRINASLSHSELEFLRAATPEGRILWGHLSTLRNKIVELLSSAAFTDEETWLPAICAAASLDPRLSAAGNSILRRSKVDWEDETVVAQLYLFHSKSQAAYRIHVLNLLARSRRATAQDMDGALASIVQLDFETPPAEGEATNQLAPASYLERAKLHRSLFGYLSWVAANAKERAGFEIGTDIAKKMKAFIEQQGWPVPRENKLEEDELRATAYGIMGALAARNTTHDPEAVRYLACWLLESYSRDPTPDVAIKITESLSGVSSIWNTDTDQGKMSLRSVLLTLMVRPYPAPGLVRNVRPTVVRWANRLLPYSDLQARWIDILAVAGRPDDPKDLSDAGLEGLDPWNRAAHSSTPPTYPDWAEMLTAFCGTDSNPSHHMLAMVQHDHLNGLLLVDGNPSASLDSLPWHSPPLSISINYVTQVLILTALGDYFKLSPDWSTNLSTLLRTDPGAQAKVRSYLNGNMVDPIASLLKTCLDGIRLDRPQLVERCLDNFLTVARYSPSEAVSEVADRAAELLPLITRSNKEVQTLAAQAFGILAAHPTVIFGESLAAYEKLKEMVTPWKTATGPEQSAVEGALLALAHLTSNAVYNGIPVDDGFLPTDVMQIFLGASNNDLQLVAMSALGELWTAKWRFLGEADNHDAIMARLSTEAKKGSEVAIRALGRYAMIAPEEEEQAASPDDALSSGRVGSVLSVLFGLYELRQVDAYFAVGEAITVAVACWDSIALQLTRDVDPQRTRSVGGKRSIRIDAVVDKLLGNCNQTKPSLLKASGVWLFSMVQYCSHLDEVKSRLRAIQGAFMRLLNARDELVQETAARGLSLVYERGDADLRVRLEKDLVSAFTAAGPAAQLKVDGETELFEPGMLATGEGQSVTSYKDIVNIAQEVGDQGVIYKLMSISANAAMWSVRSAFDRFGLSSILSESETDPKLYPKLYRYRFDPNHNSQVSMNRIWKALVPNEATIVNEHFDAIMQELLKSMVGSEWRVREASCSAVVELIGAVQFDKYEEYYRSIWKTGSRVLDDIKDSVRTAAWKLCVALARKLITELSESGKNKRTAAMLAQAMPFLLGDNGIDSSNQESKIFAITTLLEVASNAQELMNPYVAEVVPKLLGLLSTIELDTINFGYQRANAETRERVDRMRSMAVRQSPILTAIEGCLAFIDADVMAALAPTLREAIKSALGVPTNIGCTHALIALFTRHVQVAKPFAGSFLQLAGRRALGGNDEVSRSYARAAAYVFRCSQDAEQQTYLDHLAVVYLNSADQAPRLKVADAMVALSTVAPDQFEHHEGRTLPFVYMGTHDVDPHTSKAFKVVWETCTGSAGRTVARYAEEICRLVDGGLQTALWDIKHAAALTVGAMINDVSATLDSLNPSMAPALAGLIWPAIQVSLKLKTFDGKEDVLAAFPLFVKEAPSLWKDDALVRATMQDIMVREAKRTNAKYRAVAYTALWKFVNTWPGQAMFSTVVDVTRGDLERWTHGETAMDTDDSWADVAEKLTTAALEAVARAWSSSTMEQDYLALLTSIMDALEGYLGNERFSEIKRKTWYACVEDIFKAIPPSKDDKEHQWPLAIKYLDSLDIKSAALHGTEKMRVERAKAASAICTALKDGAFGAPSGDEAAELKERINGLSVGERSEDVRKAIGVALATVEGM